MKKVNEIIEFLEDRTIEIVSYGLAPNPNGFCFELYDDACSDDADVLNTMLNSLSSKEEAKLRKIIFS